MDELKENINLAFVGHVDHGKSSLIGRLLVDIGKITGTQLKEYENLALSLGDETRKYALMVHRSPEEEGKKRRTIYTSRTRIDLPEKTISIIDLPGHPDYFTNIIGGIFQADCALLVVNVKKGIQEQTIDALHILKGYEIPLIGVTISWMDEAKYSLEDFARIRNEVQSLIKSIKVRNGNVPFVPTSALEGEGVTSYREMKDFGGPTLYDVIASLKFDKLRESEVKRFVSRSDDVFQPEGVGTVMVGVVESGSIQVQDELVLEPVSKILEKDTKIRVRSMELAKGKGGAGGISLDTAHPRQIIGMAVSSKTRDLYGILKDSKYSHGIVAGGSENPPTTARSFIAEVTIVWHPTVISRGYQPVICVNSDEVAGTFSDILGKKTMWGDWQSEIVSIIQPNDLAVVKVDLLRPAVIEESQKIPWMSKFIIRDGLRVIGFGNCTKVLSQ